MIFSVLGLKNWPIESLVMTLTSYCCMGTFILPKYGGKTCFLFLFPQCLSLKFFLIVIHTCRQNIQDLLQKRSRPPISFLPFLKGNHLDFLADSFGIYAVNSMLTMLHFGFCSFNHYLLTSTTEPSLSVLSDTHTFSWSPHTLML